MDTCLAFGHNSGCKSGQNFPNHSSHSSSYAANLVQTLHMLRLGYPSTKVVRDVVLRRRSQGSSFEVPCGTVSIWELPDWPSVSNYKVASVDPPLSTMSDNAAAPKSPSSMMLLLLTSTLWVVVAAAAVKKERGREGGQQFVPRF